MGMYDRYNGYGSYYSYQQEQARKAKNSENEFLGLVIEYGRYISEMDEVEFSSISPEDLFVKLYNLMDCALIRNFTEDEHWRAFEEAYERG